MTEVVAESIKCRAAKGFWRRWPVYVIGMPVLVGCIALGFAVYLHVRANWGVVVPGKVYRSAQISRFLLHDKLVDNKIGTILVLTHDGPSADADAERREAAELGLTIFDHQLNGIGLGDPKEYLEALTELQQANDSGKAVLIHCHSGAQRTGGIVAVYDVLMRGKSPEEAKRDLAHYGWDAKNNPKLIPFLNQHMEEWANGLKERGLIPRVPEPIPAFTP